MAENTDTNLLESAGAGNTDPKGDGNGNKDQGGKAPEPKTDGGKTDADKGSDGKTNQDPKPGENKDGKPSGAAGAPEKYADFKLLEGVSFKPEQVTEFTSLAKELNLSQEAAQKLVDLQSKFAKSYADESVAGHKKMVEGWASETKKRLGASFDQEMAVAAKARDQFGTPELRELLGTTGLANHPEVITFFAKVGKGMMEDGHVEGKKVPVKSDGQLFYPDMK